MFCRPVSKSIRKPLMAVARLVMTSASFSLESCRDDELTPGMGPSMRVEMEVFKREFWENANSDARQAIQKKQAS